MNHSNSGLAHGTSGSPQLTFENDEMAAMARENEKKAQERIELYISDEPKYNLLIWGSYFCDIFKEPPLSDKGYNGFTRDYLLLERTYKNKDVTINVDEYLNDLYTYNNKRVFNYEKTREYYELLCHFLEYAKAGGKTVKVNWW